MINPKFNLDADPGTARDLHKQIRQVKTLIFADPKESSAFVSALRVSVHIGLKTMTHSERLISG